VVSRCVVQPCPDMNLWLTAHEQAIIRLLSISSSPWAETAPYCTLIPSFEMSPFRPFSVSRWEHSGFCSLFVTLVLRTRPSTNVDVF
jgi:hypothetical protein